MLIFNFYDSCISNDHLKTESKWISCDFRESEKKEMFVLNHTIRMLSAVMQPRNVKWNASSGWSLFYCQNYQAHVVCTWAKRHFGIGAVLWCGSMTERQHDMYLCVSVCVCITRTGLPSHTSPLCYYCVWCACTR